MGQPELTIADVRRLDIRPDDTLIFIVSKRWSEADIGDLHDTVDALFPEGVRFLVVPDDVDVVVARASGGGP